MKFLGCALDPECGPLSDGEVKPGAKLREEFCRQVEELGPDRTLLYGGDLNELSLGERMLDGAPVPRPATERPMLCQVQDPRAGPAALLKLFAWVKLSTFCKLGRDFLHCMGSAVVRFCAVVADVLQLEGSADPPPPGMGGRLKFGRRFSCPMPVPPASST